MKHLTLSLVLLLSLFFSPCRASGSTPEEEARLWCDENILQPVEGIWEYPEDNTRVVIKADDFLPGSFTLTVLDSPDCRLNPGDIIGRLYPSVDSSQFKFRQWTSKDNLALINPFDCTAVISADGESIRINAPKLKFKITPSVLLPKFWRLIRISISNPVDKLPVGLIKIYPGYDHNGSLRRKTRVL